MITIMMKIEISIYAKWNRFCWLRVRVSEGVGALFGFNLTYIFEHTQTVLICYTFDSDVWWSYFSLLWYVKLYNMFVLCLIFSSVCRHVRVCISYACLLPNERCKMMSLDDFIINCEHETEETDIRCFIFNAILLYHSLFTLNIEIAS